ncbi:MAG: sensor histidine kinase [Syntrophobacteria bacterium]
MSVVRDITPRVRAEEERKKLQAQLLRIQTMESLGTLAGGIAHDFNSILMPITLNTELVLRTTDESDKASEYLGNVLEAAQRGRELVKQIVTFSRRKERRRESIDIAPVIKEALKFLKASLPATIEIRTKVKDDFSSPSVICSKVFGSSCLYPMERRKPYYSLTSCGPAF